MRWARSSLPCGQGAHSKCTMHSTMDNEEVSADLQRGGRAGTAVQLLRRRGEEAGRQQHEVTWRGGHVHRLDNKGHHPRPFPISEPIFRALNEQLWSSMGVQQQGGKLGSQPAGSVPATSVHVIAAPRRELKGASSEGTMREGTSPQLIAPRDSPR